jgi:hypothetical protein
MEQHPRPVGRKMGLVDRLTRQGHGKRQAAPGQALGKAEDIGPYPGVLAGKQRAGAAPAGQHLVRDQQHAMGGTDGCSRAEHRRRIKAHATRPQQQRFDDERRDIAAPACLFQSVQHHLALSLWKGQRLHLEEQRLIGAVVDAARANRHGADRVAMIAMLEREDPVPRPAVGQPIAQSHFQRYLDRRRSGIGKEQSRQRPCRQRNDAARHCLGRRMGEAGKNDLVEVACLLADCSHDPRVAVAVGGHPPGGDCIDDPPAVGGEQCRARGFHHKRNGFTQAMLCKRMPDRGFIDFHIVKSCSLKPMLNARDSDSASGGTTQGSRPNRLT